MKQRTGMTINVWLASGGTGTATEIADKLNISPGRATAALKVLLQHGMAKIAGSTPGRGKGPQARVWATTYGDEPAGAPKRTLAAFVVMDSDDSDLLPLSRIPAASIVAKAIANRHPLDLAWQGVRA